MNKKTILIIILAIAVIVGASVILYGNPLQSVMTHKNNGPVIYNNTIDGVGAFQSVNATNFKENETSAKGQVFYTSNVTGCEVTILPTINMWEIPDAGSVKVNDSPKGHTIYKITANMGDHKGEVRYISYLQDSDNDRWITVASPDKNLTDLMVDSFKVLNPVKK